MKVVRFFSKKEFEGLGQPVPAKRLIPQWYKDSETTFIDEVGEEQPGVKKCVPFFDAMLTGYMLVSPVDIFVSTNEDGTLNIRWNSPETYEHLIVQRDAQLGAKLPKPPGYYDNSLAVRSFWGWKTPRGWSMLVIPPLNRHDLPWTVTAGIMDSDTFSSSGSVPFFLKAGVTGMIPAGTPMAQLIPLKRASWKSIKNDQGLVYLDDVMPSVVRKPGKSYKKLFWSRKEYN